MAVADESDRRKLESVRRQLDDLDRQLVEILGRRFETGNEAARLKRALGVPIHDAAREEQVVNRAMDWARSAGLPEEEVSDLFRRLISISRGAQIDSG